MHLSPMSSEERSCSPTVSEHSTCSPTEIDPESDGDRFSTGDDLLDLWFNPEFHTRRIFFSTGEDCRSMRLSKVQAAHDAHVPWYEELTFVNRVHDVLPKPEPAWFNKDCFRRTYGLPFEDAHDIALDFVRSKATEFEDFKIGITCHPGNRFRMYLGDKGWVPSRMFLLYCHYASKKSVHGSSGSMEVALIEGVRQLPGCLNVKPGGESATAVSPHFTYMVVGSSRDMFPNDFWW